MALASVAESAPVPIDDFQPEKAMKAMKFASNLLLAAVLLAGSVTGPVLAGASDPLFVNLTTDDPHRASMGITFGRNQLERGHPLTIFLNDKAVLIAAKTNANKYGEHQRSLGELAGKGASLLICPMCMKHYGVNEADLLPGLKVGNPDLVGDALFRDRTKTLTW